ncbi:hypothetical protein CHLRE_03g148800v5 [Chlamydomonas reinhardtii]|uniref:O-methyltransferase domain-containing protein n=1 Tax=Chlamydomonas reinhardtii TaxID=3055 RepID=A0A2K3DVI9_CHLRE|nr:uncharacterized protein CHLRE_03g148800v5 [Chlamydomonas reinhardtii]PNW84557.1 hypothetical protein CHLRE_03g148800v5 [Chlamydomonas reinhardtii]
MQPDVKPVLDLLNGFRASQTLLTAVQLGLFECLEHTNELSVDGLASALAHRLPGSPAPSLDGLDRLCRACVALGLLSSPANGQFALTDAARAYLLASAPQSLAGYCVHSSQVVWPLFGGLPAAVTTGSNVWQQQFGAPGSDVFARVYDTPGAVRRFMSGMHSFATLSAPAVVRAFDLSFATRLLDLGGATGALAAAACAAYPSLEEAVVVDLPHVLELAQRHFAPTAAPREPAAPAEVQGAGGGGGGGFGGGGDGGGSGGGGSGDCGCNGRLRWLAADFFTETDKLPQQVDLVVLSRILHDWDGPRCAQLLARVHGLLRPGGAVLVAEMLLQPDRLGPPAALLQDLNMLCQTHGRERSLAEYEQLLQAAGFVDVRGHVTGTYLDAVLARKPEQHL